MKVKLLKFWNKMKSHWGIDNDFQVALILTVFALTGFSTLYAHQGIDYLLGIEEGDSFFLKLLVFMLIVMPVYTVLLYIWGIVFGQRKFFTKFLIVKYKLLTGKYFFSKLKGNKL